ncbi:hypothetical protein GCM10020295_74100 [Streptomyces cinereospinus]
MTELGLPEEILACLFDLDGVVTKTAVVHAAAWKETFDAVLREREGDAFRPFDAVADYDEYVDGRPRADGVRTFLASRGIRLPEGTPEDPPDAPHRARRRQPQERPPAGEDPHRRCRGLRRHPALPRGGPRPGPAHRDRLLQRQLP